MWLGKKRKNACMGFQGLRKVSCKNAISYPTYQTESISFKIDISNKVNPPNQSFFLLFWKGVATGMMFLLAWPGDYAQKLHQPWKVHSCGGRYNVWCFRLIPEFLICWSWCGMDFLIELWFEVYQLNVYEVAEGSNLLGHELPTSQPIRCHPRVTDPNNPRIWMMQYQHAYWAITLELIARIGIVKGYWDSAKPFGI